MVGSVQICLLLLPAVLAFAPLGFMGAKGVRFQRQMVMAQTDISMPALSSTMKEGKIVSWNKKVGDKVSSGDVLLVVESDKADMDVESFEEGFLAAIYTPEGGSADVGAVVAVLVDSVEEIKSVGSTPTPAAAAAAPAAAAAAPAPAPAGNAPAFESIAMPALSSTMKEGKIVSWNKKVGDKVSSGDVLLVVESDKADMDVESFEEGFLAYIAVKDGEVAEVGAPLGYLAASAAEVGAVQAWVAGASGSPAAPASAPAAPAAPAPVAAPAPAGPVAAAISAVSRVVNSGRVAASGYAKAMAREQGIDLSTVSPSRADGYILSKDLSTATATPTATAPATPSTYTPAPGTINASPMARKLASENNLDISAITGTGNFGRVMPDDVLRAAGRFVEPVKATPTAPTAPAPAAAAAVSGGEGKEGKVEGKVEGVKVLDGVVPMDGMQKAVAKNMERTLGVPVFRVSREIFTDDFDALYALLKPKGVTVSAMLAKAAAMVLVKHPVVNAAYDVGGGVRYSKDVNIAMAVAIEGGLMTPTIVGADQMDLFQVGRRWKELLGKAKEKKLTPAEYSTGTFTISNLGMFGVAQFDAILPPGTGSILAVAASTPKVVQMKNGYFGVRKSMTVTITCDHRHIYGADAAEFLKDLADLIENHPNTLTMG